MVLPTFLEISYKITFYSFFLIMLASQTFFIFNSSKIFKNI